VGTREVRHSPATHTMSSIHGRLKGKKWSAWTEDLGPDSPPGDTGRGGQCWVPSPLQPSDDVMKLPREDMHIYGQCPIWERFILVTCEKCSRKVKIEALESHLTLRHGSKSERSAYHKEMAARASSALKACQVKLTPMQRGSEEVDEKKGLMGGGVSAVVTPTSNSLVSTCTTSAETSVSGSSSSTSPLLPVSYPSTPPQFRVSSPSPLATPTPPPISAVPSIQPADSASAPDTRSPSPELALPAVDEAPGEAVEEMDVDDIEPRRTLEDDVEMVESKSLSVGNVFKQSAAATATTATASNSQSSARSCGSGSNGGNSSSSMPVNGINFVAEEADSTTHNVISIPDSDDIPNIEIGIISEGQVLQVLDSINTKYNVSLLKTDTSVDSTTCLPNSLPTRTPVHIMPPKSNTLHHTTPPATSVHAAELRPSVGQSISNTSCSATTSVSMSLPLTARPLPSAPLAMKPVFHTHPLATPTAAAEKMEVEPHPTHYITVSPLSKGSPKKPVIIKAALEKKPTGREREYDPNKHCGVWDADAKRNCTRSLTCKSHSVYLKRKVSNRSGPFDELLAAHKAEKEASSKLADSGESEPTSILARRLQLTPSNQQKLWEQTEPVKQNSLLKPSVTKRNFFHPTTSVPVKDNYCDENLHYTTDHPKPLAVCTFGGKRIGGLFIADRSRFLTRKVMKIAISSSGLQRLQPTTVAVARSTPPPAPTLLRATPATGEVKRVAGLISAPVTSRQQSLPYIVNLQGGAGVSRVAVTAGGSPRVGTLQLGTAGLQTQHFLVQDAFKTDIQDFKGGIKFELGRNIHHVLPAATSDAGGSS